MGGWVGRRTGMGAWENRVKLVALAWNGTPNRSVHSLVTLLGYCGAFRHIVGTECSQVACTKGGEKCTFVFLLSDRSPAYTILLTSTLRVASASLSFQTLAVLPTTRGVSPVHHETLKSAVTPVSRTLALPPPLQERYGG